MVQERQDTSRVMGLLKKDNFVETVVEEEDSLAGSSGHVFEDEQVAEYYRDKYFECNYEGRHHFDPKLEWTEQEERALIRKTEWRVTALAFFLFFALNVDRGNLNNALSDNFLNDLNMSTDDLNLGRTINLIFFSCAEIPSQLISKKVGCDVWIPIQMSLWSVVAICQAGLKNRTGFIITRALLGMLQGGFIADVNLWLSYFYTSRELPMRITIFYIANPLTSVVCSLLGYGILHLGGKGGLEGWRWLFMLEGIFTLLVGIWAFFVMAPSAVQTKGLLNKKGWYTEREEKIMVNRILRDDPSKGDMNNRQGLDYKRMFKAIFDWDILPVYIVRILGDIGVAPVANYLSLLLRQLGFSTFNTNLLSIPPSILSIVTMVPLTWLAGKFRNGNAIANYIQSLWCIPFLAILRYWPGAQLNSNGKLWPTYVILVLALGYPCAEPITITWTSANANSVGTRAVSAAVVNIFSQMASIIGNNMYRSDDAPLYHRGNFQLLMIAIGQIGFITLTVAYYKWRNYKREKVWSQMSSDKQIQYLNLHKFAGNKRLDFRFAY